MWANPIEATRRKLMAVDPVCNMEVDEKDAEFTSDHQGKKYFFCSEDCKRQFDKNPQQFVKAA
jgi:YHS domain-containing protein